MRIALILLAAFATACGPVAPVVVPQKPPIADTQPAQSITEAQQGAWHQVAVRTPSSPCDGMIRQVVWTAKTDYVIMKVRIWIGTTWQAGSVIDVSTSVLTSTGFVLAFLGLDHYQPFSGVHQLAEPYDPPVAVPAGTILTVQHRCADYGGQPGTRTSATNVFLDLQ